MANSIYDNFGDNLGTYKRKQRLSGGQIDPRVVGSLAEADLNSRYADQRSRRSQDLQERSINNQYALGQAGIAQSQASLAQSQAMNDKILKAQEQSAGIGNMGSIANILMSGVGLGNKMGLWGAQPKESSMEMYYKNLLNERQGSQGASMPSLYDDVGTGGDWFAGPASSMATDYAPTDYGTSGGDYWEEMANEFADWFG
jgi:hypothetical protein